MTTDRSLYYPGETDEQFAIRSASLRRQTEIALLTFREVLDLIATPEHANEHDTVRRYATACARTHAVALVRADQALSYEDATEWPLAELGRVAADTVADPRSGWAEDQDDPEMVDLAAAYAIVANLNTQAGR